MENNGDGDKYLSLSEDWSELMDGYSAKERSIAGLKLLGKSIFNVGKFTLTEALPKMAEKTAKMAEEAAKNKK
ncbi:MULTISPECIES: hypothetical protein [Burkholderia cepacia complex]|uniref:hypothetical protein n=1 Tax=Burkholderia cepacia complex TaxID=87882 RepID=UPI0011B1FC7F|nr:MULTISPECIES: hypothetical protein [Burkholderia cepacia complex]MBR7901172.1 hypothetical protein [Burkholderia multivorans]MBR8049004.1 hypothetical protein [Burkholderia multivorans]MBU9144158.1 hypothetical protein [Burkholderia multivorans]MBU9439787.1 hypothetical protein [Burkholderia multivorans]MBU9513873.1 hypothetical protein [Burkholderia multivorans]